MSTPQKRLNEFRSKPLSVKKQKLVCDACQIELDHTRKSSIISHLETEKHKKNTIKIKTAKTLNFDNDPNNEFKKDLILAFSSSNIPLHKLQNTNLNKFFTKYLQPNYTVPSTSSVRRYLPTVYQNEYENLISFFQQSKVAIICDETSDVKNRSVFQIILIKLDFNCDSSPKLVDTIFLETVDHASIARAVCAAMYKMKIDFENVMAFVSDNASYMIKSFKTVLKPLMQNCTHVTRFAHIISLVGETWRSNLTTVDQIVANFKSIFSRGSLRKQRYLLFLKENGVQDPKMYPMPVVTRWNTWFKAEQYISENFDLIKLFISNEILIEKTIALEKLEKLFEVENLKNEMIFVAERCDKFKYTILKFEKQDFPATKCYNLITDLYFWMTGQLDIQVNTLPDENIFAKKLFTDALGKLKKYLIDGAQPGMDLFRYSRFFDPTEASFFSNVLAEHNLPKQFLDEIIDEWPIYQSILNEESIDLNKFNLEKWWFLHKSRLPKMFKLARWLVKVPSSSCDSERALSKYKIILADNRQNMSDETIKINNFLYFNSRKDQILESSSSDKNNDEFSDDDDIVQIEDDSDQEN